MNLSTLTDLQASVLDGNAFHDLKDYMTVSTAFLTLMQSAAPTRIISPTNPNYIFFQFDATYAHKITRPLNINLLFEQVHDFHRAFERFVAFLDDLRREQHIVAESEIGRAYIETKEINKVIYTLQQAIGCITYSFETSNQARKRVGQLFERLIKLIIQHVGLECEPRTIRIPIPDFPGYVMPYELDVVFSRDKAILTTESKFIHASEIVGSVKTTSKDRIDKVFLDKYLLTKLLGRDIPVIAIFLHDVQRAVRGNSIFGVNTTFKTNHFLGYTVALNRLDGVYYVDPRPEMKSNERLREQIFDFQQFLVRDLWILSK